MNSSKNEHRSFAPYVIATEKLRTPTRFNLGDSVYLEAHYSQPATIHSISYWRGKNSDLQLDEYSKGRLLFEVPQAQTAPDETGQSSCYWSDEQLFSSKQELASYLLKWLRIPNNRPQTESTNKEKAPARLFEQHIKERLEKLSTAIIKDDTPQAASYFSKLPSLEPRDWVYVVVEDENQLPKLFKVPLEGYKISRWYEQGCTCERTQYSFVNPLSQQLQMVDQLGQTLFLQKEEAIAYATQLIYQKLGIEPH